MQHSAGVDRGRRHDHRGEPVSGRLLLAPGLGFLLLLWMWWRSRERRRRWRHRAPIARPLSGNLWAGVLLVVASGLILLLGGYRGPHVWVNVITLAHLLSLSMLVMFGAYGLSRAMAGQCWRYPLIGRPLPARLRRG